MKKVLLVLLAVFSLALSGCYFDGSTGPQGPQGIQGLQGNPGNDGSSFLAGKGAPTESTIGFSGDMYIDVDTGSLWGPYTEQDGWGVEPSGFLKCECKEFFCGKGDHNDDGHPDNGDLQ